MAESVSWKKRRGVVDRLSEARAAKRARTETSDGLSSSEPVTRSSADDEHCDDEFGEDSMSLEEAQDCVDDWVLVLPIQQRKELAVALFVSYRRRQKMGVMDAAQEAASMTGLGERTVRRFWKEWSDNGGSFDESEQGKFRRPKILDDDECRERAVEWIRLNSVKEGEANMTARSFACFVNDKLLPNTCLLPGFPRTIGVTTARRWLCDLGLQYMSTHSKRGVFKDGHEREDVVQYRKDFVSAMREMEATHPPPPLPSDGDTPGEDMDKARAAAKDDGRFVEKALVTITHDETTFHANDDQRYAWQEAGTNPLLPKSQGGGVMVADFIDEYNGFLRLTDEEFERGKAQYGPDLEQEARHVITYGANADGYWNGDKFFFQVQDAHLISLVKYPRDRYDVVWQFDHSPGHAKMAPDALVAHHMNVSPGGSQPKMRDTVWGPERVPQKMVLEDGRAKGLKLVLEEREISTAGMKRQDMVDRLAGEEDFRAESCQAVMFLRSKGDCARLLPKFHCELNSIERVWGQGKRETRAMCDYSMAGLRSAIRPALDSVSLDLIRKYFRKSRDYARAYACGTAIGSEMASMLKKYKSNRRIFLNG